MSDYQARIRVIGSRVVIDWSTRLERMDIDAGTAFRFAELLTRAAREAERNAAGGGLSGGIVGQPRLLSWTGQPL